VFDVARLRFLLENHAHDIYDAHIKIHAGFIHRATFFFFEEMRNLIRQAHASSRERQAKDDPGARPLMGHDVLVSNLWQVRNLWDWLAPGYSRNPNERDQAFANAAFVAYENLNGYRDFELRKESDDRVGLWCKEYMSDPEYKYVGTVMTQAMFDEVVGQREPAFARTTDSSQKQLHHSKAARGLKKAMNGPFRDQFSADRLRDAVAMLKGDWAHFKDSPGNLPPELRRLPHELADHMRNAGLRRVGEVAAGRFRSEVQSLAGLDGSRPPPSLRQRAHSQSHRFHILRSASTQLAARYGLAPSREEFERAPVAPGCFIATHAAPASPLGRAVPALVECPWWIWRVLDVHQPGSSLDANSRDLSHAKKETYECQLYTPGAEGDIYNRPLRPCWDKLSRTMFLAPPGHKRRRVQRPVAETPGDSDQDSDALENQQAESIYKPLMAFLTSRNLVGGGFMLTSTSRLPGHVRKYLQEAAAVP
jgi:hypothetical protein